jgi:hypothetical protein
MVLYLTKVKWSNEGTRLCCAFCTNHCRTFVALRTLIGSLLCHKVFVCVRVLFRPTKIRNIDQKKRPSSIFFIVELTKTRNTRQNRRPLSRVFMFGPTKSKNTKQNKRSSSTFFMVEPTKTKNIEKNKRPSSTFFMVRPFKTKNTKKNKRPPSINFKFQRKYLITKENICTLTKTAYIPQENEMQLVC